MVEMLGSILFFCFLNLGRNTPSKKFLMLLCVFDLAEKYKGIVIHDVSLSGGDGGGSYDYYRVVVDLEWSSGKTNYYGKKGLVYRL